MPDLHHVGYWVDDLAAAQARWGAELGVGPFEVIEHVPFDSFALADGDPAGGDVVFDHSAAFAAWGPVVVELDQVHAIDDRLARRRAAVPAPDRGAPAQRRDRRDAQPAVRTAL